MSDTADDRTEITDASSEDDYLFEIHDAALREQEQRRESLDRT